MYEEESDEQEDRGIAEECIQGEASLKHSLKSEK